jgi:hypothetical protein
MTEFGLVENVEYWRGRAEETRVLAEGMKDDTAREIMLGAARDYDRMADRAEELRRRQKHGRFSDQGDH